MSVRSEKTTTNQLSPSEAMAAAITDAQPGDAHLAEGASYTTNTPENALHRTIVVSVRASLNELCLQRQKGTWAPSQEALRSILQSRYAHGNGSNPSDHDSHPGSQPHIPDSRLTYPRSPPARSKYTSLDGSAEQQGDLKVRVNPRPRPS